ncbi:MAG TPA: hypothetical protein PLZ61_07440, partial [Candidatus Cryosericum sp.]|nr:hypothetical protein [Candidatus Cryosericum sp.]
AAEKGCDAVTWVDYDVDRHPNTQILTGYGTAFSALRRTASVLIGCHHSVTSGPLGVAAGLRATLCCTLCVAAGLSTTL